MHIREIGQISTESCKWFSWRRSFKKPDEHVRECDEEHLKCLKVPSEDNVDYSRVVTLSRHTLSTWRCTEKLADSLWSKSQTQRLCTKNLPRTFTSQSSYEIWPHIRDGEAARACQRGTHQEHQYAHVLWPCSNEFLLLFMPLHQQQNCDFILLHARDIINTLRELLPFWHNCPRGVGSERTRFCLPVASRPSHSCDLWHINKGWKESHYILKTRGWTDKTVAVKDQGSASVWD